MLGSGILFVDTDRNQKMSRILKGDGMKGALYLGNETGAMDL